MHLKKVPENPFALALTALPGSFAVGYVRNRHVPRGEQT